MRNFINIIESHNDIADMAAKLEGDPVADQIVALQKEYGAGASDARKDFIVHQVSAMIDELCITYNSDMSTVTSALARKLGFLRLG